MLYVPYLAIIAAYALIIVPRLVAGREMTKLAGGYDNHDPRSQQQQLVGFGKRATAAHYNAIEAFPPFTIAVLAALQRAVSVTAVASLAIAFIALRTVYLFGYLRDTPSLRSGAWTLGVLATTALMVLAVIGG